MWRLNPSLQTRHQSKPEKVRSSDVFGTCPGGGIPVSGKRLPGGVPRERKTIPRGTSTREPFSARGDPPGPSSKTNARFAVSSHALGYVQCALLKIETPVGHSSASQSIVMECRIAKQSWKLGLLKAGQHLFNTKRQHKYKNHQKKHHFGGVT